MRGGKFIYQKQTTKLILQMRTVELKWGILDISRRVPWTRHQNQKHRAVGSPNISCLMRLATSRPQLPDRTLKCSGLLEAYIPVSQYCKISGLCQQLSGYHHRHVCSIPSKYIVWYIKTRNQIHMHVFTFKKSIFLRTHIQNLFSFYLYVCRLISVDDLPSWVFASLASILVLCVRRGLKIKGGETIVKTNFALTATSLFWCSMTYVEICLATLTACRIVLRTWKFRIMMTLGMAWLHSLG